MKLTNHSVAELVLPPGKIGHTEWDDELPGFGVLLRQCKHGVNKTFRIQFRVGLQQRSKHLDARKVKLDDARKVARQLFAQAHLGVDPAAEKAKARASAAATVSERYLAVKRQALTSGTYSASTLVAAERYFKMHWVPLRDWALDDITRKDVTARLQELVTKHGRSAAARARNTLNAFYRWAMAEGLADANPVISTNDPEAGVLPRERVLSDSELKVLWDALDDDDYSSIVKLLILTGCRHAEIGNRAAGSRLPFENQI